MYQAKSCEYFVSVLPNVGLGWRTVDPGFVSRYKTVACFLQWAAGADICTLPPLSRIYCTQVWAHPLQLDPAVLADQTVWTDGWTCTKKCTFSFFFQKISFGSDGSKLDGHFLSLDAFFPTFGCHPDGAQPQKGKFEGEKGLCMFSLCGQIMQGNGVAKLEQWTRMSATKCWDPPSCVQQWEQRPAQIKARKVQTLAAQNREHPRTITSCNLVYLPSSKNQDGSWNNQL